jgi:hypothetical protein
MIYDRCPNCSRAMTFHAITTARGVWRRWVECTSDECKTFMSADEKGMEVYVGTAAPPKAALSREVPREGR